MASCKCSKKDKAEGHWIYCPSAKGYAELVKSSRMGNQKQPCSKCGACLQSYWLKDGICNACRNPNLVVTALVK